MTWAAAVLVAVAAGLAVLLLAVRSARRRARRRAAEYLGGRTPRLADRANLVGLASRGPGQIRGNGILLLTEDALWFTMLVPARVIEIPLHAITEVTTARSHVGKTILHPLLKVVYRSATATATATATASTADGAEDAAAWYVRDLPRWLEALAPHR